MHIAVNVGWFCCLVDYPLMHVAVNVGWFCCLVDYPHIAVQWVEC